MKEKKNVMSSVKKVYIVISDLETLNVLAVSMVTREICDPLTMSLCCCHECVLTLGNFQEVSGKRHDHGKQVQLMVN